MNSLKLVSMGILCLGFVCLNADEISQKEILGKVLFMEPLADSCKQPII